MNRILHRSVISVDAEITLERDYCRMASAPMDLVTSAMRLPQIAILLVRFVIHGPDGFRDREGLDLWYRPKREKAR